MPSRYRSLPQREHFRMRCGISVGFATISAASNYRAAFVGNDAADRHIAMDCCEIGLVEGQPHEQI